MGLIVAFFSAKNKKTQKELEKTVMMASKLQKDLEMVMEYNQGEKDMINDQIMTFKKQHLNAKQAGDGNYDADQAQTDLEKLLIPASELACKDVIGKGSFGTVFMGEYRGQKVAVKTLKEIGTENLQRFKEEVLLNADLRHTNIVTLVGAVWEVELMALVMEFCEKGMSSTLLEREGHNFSWQDPLHKWSLEIAQAMKYLHQAKYYDARNNVQVKGIIHRDLKPDNCLVDDNYTIKIADFGEARAFMENATMTVSAAKRVTERRE